MNSSLNISGNTTIYGPLTVNNNVKFGDEILIETENQLQYSVCGYFDNLRSSFGDDGLQVSNIIGWAYDGNPIYGSYGYSDSENSNYCEAVKKQFQ